MRGFTLIEIIVAIAIIAILTTLSVASFRSNQQSDSLTIAALRVAEEFRTAQNQAASGYTDMYSSAKSFGVHIDKESNSLFAFADMYTQNGIGTWTAQEADASSTDAMLPNRPISVDPTKDGSVIIDRMTIDGGSVTTADFLRTILSRGIHKWRSGSTDS
jgi:prepilin-type N-terminal cleavage/methylation domain-containing protein